MHPVLPYQDLNISAEQQIDFTNNSALMNQKMLTLSYNRTTSQTISFRPTWNHPTLATSCSLPENNSNTSASISQSSIAVPPHG